MGSEKKTAFIKPRLSSKINTNKKMVFINIPIGTAPVACAANRASWTKATKTREINIVEGRLLINPPFLLPRRSAIKVAPLIHTPATINEVIIFSKKVLSIISALFLIGHHNARNTFMQSFSAKTL